MGRGGYWRSLSRVEKLPFGQEPKFKIGDLVCVTFSSDEYYTTSSYILKDGIGLVAEVTIYECKEYGVEDYCDRKPFYITEYKVIPTSKDTTPRYVSEKHLTLVEK